jgi:hypothetical protein
MRRPSKIRLFVNDGVCNSDLPLQEAPCPTASRSFCELRNPQSGSSVRFKKRADAKEFLERQWSVLVPFFHGSDGTHIPHRDFGPEDILPFLSHEEAAKEGGSGKVFKVEIHPDHHSFQKVRLSCTRSIPYCNADTDVERLQHLCSQSLEVARRKSFPSGSQSFAKAQPRKTCPSPPHHTSGNI